MILSKDSSKHICACFITIVSCLVCCLPTSCLYAAVAPNGQPGACGPYYIWYQMTPDSYPSLIDYIDLCGITFDISDVIKDFDFVRFTDTETHQRAALDLDQDGISDLYFAGKIQNHLKWKPPNGCVRIPLQECQGGSGLKEQCGYAMMSIQPKSGFQQGSARINIGVHAKCPPNGTDCSRTYELKHQYANCFDSSIPEFMIHKKVNRELVESYSVNTFEFSVTVQNTGDRKENATILTDTVSTGTQGGTLKLSDFKIMCSEDATCSILSVTTQQIRVSLGNIPPNKSVGLFYTMTAPKDEIPDDEYSYFTNTATLSTGTSARVTVGVKGTNENLPRKERPIKSSL